MANLRVFIEGSEYQFFTNISVRLKYDSVASTFSITSNFIGTEEQRELLRPLQYKQVQIYVGGPNDRNLILTGLILRHEFKTTGNPEGIKISGYSLPGVLADCEIPTSVYPLQDDNKSIKDITEKILQPFGLQLYINQIATEDANRVVEQTTADEVGNAASYIVKMASQYNIVVGHTRRGRLLFTRVRADEQPRSNYVEGQGDFISATLKVDGQAMHNRYTILRQPDYLDTADTNPEETVNNNLVPVFRPKVKKQTIGNTDVINNAARSARMRGLADSVSITLQLSNLHYQDGSIITPNRIITLTAPSIYINNKISIFVQEVTLNQTAAGVSSTLKCLLREALTGDAAQNIF